MESGGPKEQADGGEADNVIKFPRDWFGSKDDLIPFGPAADRLEAAAAESAAAPADADEDRSSALSAADFWGEDSGALHQPVAAVPAAQSAPEELPVLSLAGRDRSAQGVSKKPPRGVFAAASGLRPSRVSLRTAVVVVAAALLIGVTAAAFAATTGGASRGASAAAAKVAAAPQIAAPAPAGLDRLSPSKVALAAQTTTARHDAHAHVTPKVHRKVARKPHRATGRKSTRHRAVAKTRSTTRDVSVPSDRGDDTTSAGSGAVTAAPATAAPVSGDASSSAATSSAATGSPAGPGGLGSAVGSNCNPTCTAP